jgi:hypothetical protein
VILTVQADRGGAPRGGDLAAESAEHVG